MRAIVFLAESGRPCVVLPDPGCGLSIVQIAAKDVPAGRPYKIVDAADIPSDRAERDLWEVDAADLTDGVGADYGAGSVREVIGWAEDGSPIVREPS